MKTKKENTQEPEPATGKATPKNESSGKFCKPPSLAAFLSQDLSFWKLDIEQQILSLSPSGEPLADIPDEVYLDLPLSAFFSAVSKHDLDAVHKAFQNIFEGKKQNVDVAYRVQHDDGGWAWILSRGKVVEFKNSKPAVVAGFSTDISRLRSDTTFQQNALGVSSEAYHTMLENSPDLVVRLDRELFPLYINPKVTTYLAQERKDFLGTDSAESLGIEPEQMTFLHRNINKVFDEKVSVREMVSFKTAYGNIVTGEYSFWPEFDKQDNVISVMTQFRDLTEQLQAEERARLSESRLAALNRLSLMESASESEVIDYVLSSMRELTDSLISSIFIPDGDLSGKGILHWSAAEEIPGLDLKGSGELTLSQDFVDSMRSDEDGLVLRGIKNGDGRTPLVQLEESKLSIIRVAVAPAMEGTKVACLAFVNNKRDEYDQSDLLQVETFINGAWLILRRFQHLRELQNAKEAAEEANKTKAVFLANVNHELRTPLTSILGYAEAMSTLTDEQGELRASCLEVIQRNAEQMRKLIEDLLALSRSENVRPLSPLRIKIKELVNDTVEMMKPQINAWKLGVVVDVPDDLYIYADPQSISQVMTNLLDNACRHSAPFTNIEISAGKDAKNATVSIRDHGSGIDPDDLDHIFDRFYIGKQGGNGGHQAMGLGLAICKYLLGLQGGRIWAENIPYGTTFHFSLPLA